jgi:hypothetical protein
MESTTPEPPETRDQSTLEGHITKVSSTYERSIQKRDSTYSEKQAEPGKPSEKALEEAAPNVDESKILQGRKLFFAFVAMLLSVLLIALGAFFHLFCAARQVSLYLYLQTKLSLPPLCKEAHSELIFNYWLIYRQACHCFTLRRSRPNQLDS